MWIAVEGIVGAGKTTTAELVGSQTNLAPVIERSDQHPLLHAYYGDPSRFALETELAFMVLQAHQVNTIDVPDGLVSDFAPAKNFVFARLTCDAPDLGLLESVDLRLWRDLPRPDLTVVLDVPADVCLRRIARRGREYEQGLTIADLDRLREGYMDALQGLGTKVRRIDLDGTENSREVASAVIDIAELERRA